METVKANIIEGRKWKDTSEIYTRKNKNCHWDEDKANEVNIGLNEIQKIIRKLKQTERLQVSRNYFNGHN